MTENWCASADGPLAQMIQFWASELVVSRLAILGYGGYGAQREHADRIFVQRRPRGDRPDLPL